MRLRFLIVVAVGVVVGGAPVSAFAKGELSSARLCGASGCVAVTSAGDLRSLGAVLMRSEQDGDARAPSLQGFVVLRAPAWATLGRAVFLVPKAGLLEGAGSWIRLPAPLAVTARRLAARLALLRPTGVHVWVDGRDVLGQRVGAALLGRMPAVRPPANVWGSRMVAVSVGSASAQPSPWSDENAAVWSYFPRYSVIERGRVWNGVPATVNQQLRAAAGWVPARDVRARGTSDMELVTVIAGVVGMVIAAWSAVWIRRRRHHGRPATV